MKTLFASIGCCAMVGMVGFSPAQAQQEDRLVSLFAGLSQKGSVSAELEKQVVAAIDSIPAMTGEQVSMAIPAIMPAIRAGNERVQGLAALVCLAIVVRPDGGDVPSAVEIRRRLG